MINARNITKSYRMGDNVVYALKNADISIETGEFVCITGSSGSGKSTLMNILGCLDRPDAGEYKLCGRDVSRLNGSELSAVRNTMLGFIFQGFNLVSGLTARENVELPLLYRHVPRAERERLSSQALADVGLSERAEHRPFQLSGGQQQRVAIARAIAAKPPLILADEPCGNLDSKSGAAVMEILRGLNRAGRTIVMITHDENAARIGSRRIHISDGTVRG